MSDQESLLTEQLKQHFDLHMDPFSPLNKVFYEGGQRHHNLETLRHMSIFGDMVLLLTGEKGAGKSCLIEAFIARQSEEVELLHPSVNVGLTTSSILSELASLLGVTVSDQQSQGQLVVSLITSSEQRFKESGKRVLWILDDADGLNKSELHLIVTAFRNLPPESGVVLLISGLPGLLDDLRPKDSDVEEWLHQIHLKPFAVHEVLEYLNARMQAAGYAAQLDLSDAQVEQLSEMGKGLPGRINRIFGSIILGFGSFSTPPKSSNSNMAQRVLFGLAAILLLSFLFVSYQYGVFDSQDEDALVASQKAAEEKRRMELEQQARIAMLNLAIENTSPVEEYSAQQELAITEVESEGLQVADSELNGSLQEIEEDSVTKVVESKMVEPESESEVEQPTIPDVEELVSKPVSEKPQVIVKPPEAKVNGKAGFYRSAEWMRHRGVQGYTYQVLGSYNEKTATSFIEKVPVSDPDLYYIESRYKGKEWFIVLYGHFDSKPLARERLSSAPGAVQKQKPWLRSMSGVVDSLPSGAK